MIVYMATNTINNKVYIGQTVQKFHRRKTGHLYAARRGSSLRFHRAIRKYGEENFSWEIIYHADNLQDLNNAEEYLIAEYQSRVKGYNVKFGGDNQRIPEETKRRIGKANTGKKHSVETRKKMSMDRKGEKSPHFGRKLSKSRCIDIGVASKARNCGETHPRFDATIRAFLHPEYGLAFCPRYFLCKEFALPYGDLSEVINGRRRSVKGWSLATPEYLQKLRESMGEIVCKQ